MSTERDLDTRGCGKMTDDNSDVSLAIHALQAEMDKLSAEVDRLTAIDLEARGYADMAEAADLRAEAAEKEVAGWKETYDRQAVLMGKYAREAMADKAKLTALVEALETAAEWLNATPEGYHGALGELNRRKINDALAHHSAPVGEANRARIDALLGDADQRRVDEVKAELATTPTSAPVEDVVGLVKLTPAMRKVVQHVADNPGKLYGSRRDFPTSVGRRDVIDRCWFGGLIAPPARTPTRTWEVTAAGRAALSPALTQPQGEERS